MGFDRSLAQRIEDYFTEKKVDYISKKMFGGLCFMVDHKMCVGIIGDQLMARVGPSQYEAFLKKAHCHEMDFTGKAMKGYIYVDGIGLEGDTELAEWLGYALAFNPEAKASKKKKS